MIFNTGDHHQLSHLMLLNDDCMEIIFDKLALASVMNLADTCTRLDTFATRYILRQIILNHNYEPKLSEYFLFRLLSQHRHRIDVLRINGGLESESKIFQLTIRIDGKYKRTISAHHFLNHCKVHASFKPKERNVHCFCLNRFNRTVELQKSLSKLIQQSLSIASENSRSKGGRLQSIKLANCSLVTPLSLIADLTVDNLKHIRELKVKHCMRICDQMMFEKIVRNLPQLESIVLNLPTYNLSQVEWGLRRMSKLRCVELCGKYTQTRLRSLMRALSDVPTLNELQLYCEVEATVGIDSANVYSDDELSKVFQQFTRVKKLTIYTKHQLDQIESIVRHFPAIERLDVNVTCDGTSSDYLKNIILASPQIRTIHYKCATTNESIKLLLQVLLKQYERDAAARSTVRLYTYGHFDSVRKLEPLLEFNRHVLQMTNVPYIERWIYLRFPSGYDLQTLLFWTLVVLTLFYYICLYLIF